MLRLSERGVSLPANPRHRHSPNKVVREMYDFLEVPENGHFLIKYQDEAVSFVVIDRIDKVNGSEFVEVKTVSGEDSNKLFARSFLCDFLSRHMNGAAQFVLHEREREMSLSEAIDNLFSP